MLRLPLGFVLALSACGARSALLDDGAGGDESGAGASATVAPVGATASEASTTGAGGGYVPCTEPTVRPPAVIFEPVGGMPVHDVALLSSSTGVVATARFTSGSQAAPDRIGHVSWDAWGAWPPAPLVPLDTSLTSWATAPVFDTASDQLSISYVDFPGCVHRTGVRLNPATSYPTFESYPLSQVVGQGCGRVPHAIAGWQDGPHATASLVPILGNVGNGYFTETAFVSADGTGITYELPACGGLPLAADLAVLDGQFVLATSHGAPDYGCDDPTAIPYWLGVGRLPLDDFHLVIAAEADDIVGVELVPRPDGLWLLYRESGASALTTPPVWAVLLDDDLNPVLFLEATSEGLSRFAAAAYPQGGLVIASDESLGSGSIDLRVWASSANFLVQHAIPTGAATPSSERLSVVASPDGTSALVGWTGVDGRGYAARVDCMIDP